ncbi:hypothetical protein [Qipengyuania spongiae]|uniref:Tetratricopeptide repeat protein n=1 Tax=Qipengyuania spongiae TaxID=2909673 RepID=A0ABY5T207_9SPHN|nr:hypothetical protein [Qipengyuania spongiae]UVI40847.1 hypothetical protein L1F33_14405 [Qipengyuania spongiae]
MAIGLFAGSQGFAFVIADRQPQLALQINSKQPQALANVAANSLSTNEGGDRSEIARRQVEEVIKLDPMQVRALVASALLQQAQNPDSARSLMAHAQSLSRRNLSVQLWWIEYWAARGDVARTLQHYDIAMRTGSSAPGILYPILVSASTDPVVAAELARVLAGNPNWGDQLVQQIAQSSTNLSGVANLFVAMSETGAPISNAALSTATARMVEADSLPDAWRAYRASRPKQADQPVRNTAFVSENSSPTMFDWQPQSGSPSASIGNGTMHLAAAAGVSGVAARQITTLSPGIWQVEFRHDGRDLGDLPYLTATCVGSGAVLGRSQSAGQSVERLTFTVPKGCVFQDLAFTLPISDRPGGASANVRELTVKRGAA